MPPPDLLKSKMEKKRRQINTKIVVALFIIVVATVVVYFVVTNPKKQPVAIPEQAVINPQSIAVFPFTNTNNDAGQQYFREGLTDGILTSLSRLKGLKVCARFSSFQFSEKEKDIKDAAKELGVHTVLKGSYQLEGDRIRLTTQLVNTENGSHVWSEQYDENIGDVFSLQDRIARSIAKELKIVLLDDGQVKPAKPAITKDAYELYLKGRTGLNLRTPAELKKAIAFFTQAIALNPQFAGAYAAMADCYNALGYGSFLAPKEAFPKALQAAEKALELDTTLAEAHASIGFYKFYYEWDWAAAEEEFRLALALNANYATGYEWYAYYLTAMERYNEAKIILEKAKTLDPLSVQIRTDMGFCDYYSGNYDSAIAKLQATLQVNPKFLLGLIWLGRSYQAKRLYPEAIAAYQKACAVAANWPVALSHIGNAYGMSGNKIAAQQMADTLMVLSQRIFVTAYGMSLIYVGLGENDKAFQWLNKAYDERSNWLVWLKKDPRWQPVSSDMRYIDLVNKIGLPNSNVRN